MENKIYVLKKENELLYFAGYESEMTSKKEEAKHLTWDQAETLQKDFARNYRVKTIIEPK